MHENRVFLRSTQAAHVADHDATDATGMPENTEQNTWNQRSYQVDARIENIASQEILCRTCSHISAASLIMVSEPTTDT